jgi:hypothetical protein
MNDPPKKNRWPVPTRYIRGEGLEPKGARELVIEYFAMYPRNPILVGPICVCLGVRYGLNETERLLEEMTGEGILARVPGGYLAR